MAFITSIIICLLLHFRFLSADILLDPIVTDGVDACLVFINGAEIAPDKYLPLMTEIQAQSSLRLWIGLPNFTINMANPFEIDDKINTVITELQAKGMPTSTPLFVGGHSQGGTVIQHWTASNVDKVVAQILMGSFLTRDYKNKEYTTFNYPVPTLTIGGELDGLARVFRIAESYYTQLVMDLSSVDDTFKFPVTIIKGVIHNQFSSGEPTQTVHNRDLYPEISYEEAHALIAKDSVHYMQYLLTGNDEAKQFLTERLDETQVFISPIIEALKYEGYHNFLPPCLCKTDICEPSPNCTAFCPWTYEVSQTMMANAGVSGTPVANLVINNTDSFHDVWETQPSVHLPKVYNSCSSPDGCTLQTSTITQGVYHTGEDLEVWKIHMDISFFDTGSLPITARELRTKMSSRQKIYSSAGIADANFEELDGGDKLCGEINQRAIDWALSKSDPNTVERYEKYGQKLVIGADINVCAAGPCWIWKELEFKESQDRVNMTISSPQFSTAMDYVIPAAAGYHYCKILSPARAMEWIYVDGLRAHYSLRNPPTAK